MTDKPTHLNYLATAFTVGFGALTAQQIIAIFGLILGILTFATNLYYKRRADHRHAQLHELQVAKLKTELHPPGDE